jgi:hypothetical protein
LRQGEALDWVYEPIREVLGHIGVNLSSMGGANSEPINHWPYDPLPFYPPATLWDPSVSYKAGNPLAHWPTKPPLPSGAGEGRGITCVLAKKSTI